MNEAVPQNCTKKYGDQPAKRVITVDTAVTLLNVCGNISGYVNTLKFNDSNGDARGACFIITQSKQPLP
ncbi:unnamed protein product, partial [Adineta steineri]